METGARFVPKKSLGQHFLTGAAIARRLCAAAALEAGESVLEIGPGTGMLTRELLAQGARVVALEADRRALISLKSSFPEAIARGALVLHHGDARRLNPAALGLKDHGYKAVANIPYYLSGHLFRTLLESDYQPSAIVFLVQDEVAKRLARDRKSSLLSLSVAAFGDVAYLGKVGRGHFVPQPRVDSAIVAVRNIGRERFVAVPMEFFFSILRLGFSRKRKQLAGNLSTRFKRSAVDAALASMGLSPTVRAEDIDLKDWLMLARALHAASAPQIVNSV
jgi:16S rRNA (adenine1518-N6/adenine1519-N6)-dimethyltransferase